MPDNEQQELTAEASDPEAVQTLVRRHFISAKQAKDMLLRGLTFDEWKAEAPASWAHAARARELRSIHPWLEVRLARRLARPGAPEAEVQASLDEGARRATGLPAARLAAALQGELDEEALRRDQPAWDVLRARLERLSAEHSELDLLTALRVAWGDGSLRRWPPGHSMSDLEADRDALRKRWPVLNKRDALVAACFGMSLDELAALRPGRCGHLPRAMEILEQHPEVHRKLARLLARKGAGDEEIRAVLDARRRGIEVWAEVAARGPVSLLTYDGVGAAGLDTGWHHPYLLRLVDGTTLHKTAVLAGFAEPDQGAVLGRMRRAPEVAEPPGCPGAVVRDRVPLEPLQEAAEEGRRVRFVLRDGRAFTGLPKGGSQYDHLVETKGGVPVALFHHAVLAAQVEGARAETPAPPEGGRKGRGRKRKGRKKRKR